MSETGDLDPVVPGAAGPGDEAEVNEADEADTAEQRAVLDADERPLEWFAQIPDDVNEADVVEQRYEVPLDEDDYR
ncbi:MAG TPA: hypothetical protein VIL71_24045 [Spirillospora sp.]